MTIGEVTRAVASFNRREEQRAKEQAAHGYLMANMIGRSIASYFAEEITMPKLEEVYPTLFQEKAKETQEKKQDLATELSVARFKQFANFHNKKFIT